MSHRNLHSGVHSLLRIFIGDFDKYHHHSLYQSLIDHARATDLAGCTVFRAFEGYGAGRSIHTEMAMEGAGERPILVECIDEAERIQKYLEVVKPMLQGSLVTEETVYVHYYSHQNVEQMQREHRVLDGDQILLRIYVGESDKIGHKPLHFVILERAHSLGIAGCTILRGISGFGASSIIHKDKLLRLSTDLPVILEIVDTEERVHQLLDQVRPLLQGFLVTEEKVRVHHYSA